ncbi:UNVERIFIED_CONTAM: hypothetical protein Scaly_2647400 [Sesamum calycinum]|uniref:Uncharacterized protein n=1 Tax=Sesamum calycinum TaxID=2727403 RepID=A0AAW2JA99_9LAMI
MKCKECKPKAMEVHGERLLDSPKKIHGADSLRYDSVDGLVLTPSNMNRFDSSESCEKVRQNILGISYVKNGIGHLPRGYFHVNRKNGAWRISLVDSTPIRKSKEEKHSNGYSRKSYEVSKFKLTISKSSSSSTKSVSVTTRSMLKKLKESSQMSPLAEYIEKNLHSPSYAGESNANESLPSSPRSVSSYSVAPVMVTNATTKEEQLANLTRAIEGLTKHVQEQDAQIARLINKANNVDASHVMGKQVETHDEVQASAKQHYTEKDKYAKELQISSDGLIPVDQLKEFIKGTIKSKIEKSSKSSLTYSKPYTPRIDGLKMPMDYQPPKFQ